MKNASIPLSPTGTTSSVESTSISGTIEKIIFKNAENGYTIGILQITGTTITFCGYMPSLQAGQSVTMTGTWVNHPKFGKQFQATQVTASMPTTVQGLRAYLSSGVIKGIGKTYADRLVARFGTSVLEIIDKQPEHLRLIPGLGDKRIEQILLGWQEHKSLAQIMVCLQDKGISTAYARRIYKQFGNRAQEIVTQEPYRLAQEVWGIGFTTADKIAQNVGIAHNSPARITAAIIHVLQVSAQQGHLYVLQDSLITNVTALLGSSAFDPLAIIKQGIEELIQNQKIFSITKDNELYICLASHGATEQAVAKSILRMLSQAVTPIDTAKLTNLQTFQLSDEQLTAVTHALTHPITIITGGPGTGKTTLVKALIAQAEKLSLSYQLAAPTGRAAKRLAQSTRKSASTIHRLLEFDPGARTFLRNEQRALTTELLIIDETSMLDIFLMHAVLKALHYHARLVLIGDVDQLPSVGPGNVLSDLIKSQKIPCIRLTHIFRQSKQSLIVSNAHRINMGEKFEFGRHDILSDFLFMRSHDPLEIKTSLEKVITSILPRYNIPSTELAILAPMHKGAAGTQTINHIMQQLVNADNQPHIVVYGSPLKINDRVMQMRNNYDKMVFNGDIGIVTAVDMENQQLTVDFDGSLVTYESGEFEELTLAYAQSIHKSQGSEYQAVVIILYMHHYTLLARKLLYTALTRAKRLVICIGDPRAFYVAIGNNTSNARVTFLASYLCS